MCIPRWNNMEMVVFTSFQGGMHVVCLKGCLKLSLKDIMAYREGPNFIDFCDLEILVVHRLIKFSTWPDFK